MSTHEIASGTGEVQAARGGESTRIEVPAREARAVRLRAGQSFRVIDVEGGQVGDLFAFVADDPTEFVSAGHTRARNDRLFPRVGEQFFSNLRRPLLEFVADDSPGHHDMLIPACDPVRYAQLGVEGPHASCAVNLAVALTAEGVAVPPTLPQPVNVFMHIPVDTEGGIQWLESESVAGASATFRALDALLVIVSACPQDVANINGGVPTPLAIELGADGAGT